MRSSFERMQPEPHPVANPRHAFLLRTAELLHRYGTPSYRLERVMSKVSTSLQVDSTYLYTPTSLIISIGKGDEERTYLRRIDSGEVDVSKLLAFDSILEELEAGKITIAEATKSLDLAASAKSYYRGWTTAWASGVACGCVSVLFGGGVAEVILAAFLGLVLSGLARWAAKWGAERGLLEPVAGFLVATISLVVAQHVVALDDRLTTLAALILPLPGLTLTVALTELALGHLASGGARLAGATVTLLTLVLGVGLAWRLVPGGMHTAGAAPYQIQWPLPEWAMWCTLPLAPAAFGVLFRVPVSQWPVIFMVSIGGFLASFYLGRWFAPEVGSFCGATVVGVGSNLYARLKNRPAMAAQTPGLLILVPGSLGYRSLIALLESQTVRGVELAFSMVLVAVSLVGGLLFANLLLPPKRIL